MRSSDLLLLRHCWGQRRHIHIKIILRLEVGLSYAVIFALILTVVATWTAQGVLRQHPATNPNLRPAICTRAWSVLFTSKKPASCVLQNPFLKPENLCFVFSRFFGFAGVIRFVAAILGQVVVLVDRCSTFRFPFPTTVPLTASSPWCQRFVTWSLSGSPLGCFPFLPFLCSRWLTVVLLIDLGFQNPLIKFCDNHLLSLVCASCYTAV